MALPNEDRRSLVYALRSQGLIKIGTTGDLTVRSTSIAAMGAAEVTLLGTVPGGRKREAALHREFAQWRHHGEWFALPDEQVEILMRRLAGEARVIQLPKAGPTKPKKAIRQQRGAVWRRVNGKSVKLRFPRG